MVLWSIYLLKFSTSLTSFEVSTPTSVYRSLTWLPHAGASFDDPENQVPRGGLQDFHQGSTTDISSTFMHLAIYGVYNTIIQALISSVEDVMPCINDDDMPALLILVCTCV